MPLVDAVSQGRARLSSFGRLVRGCTGSFLAKKMASAQVHVDFHVKIRMAVSGQTACFTLPSGSSLLDLRLAVKDALDVPVSEQILRLDASNPAEAYEIRGSSEQLLAKLDLPAEVALISVRQDPRTTSEKNCALLDALREKRFADAVEVLSSSGFPVDPNRIYKWKSDLRSFLNGGRDFGDVKDSSMSALCLAVRARKTWGPRGQIAGEGLPESEVYPVIESLLSLGANVEGICHEVFTQGSWTDIVENKTPLFLAMQTDSPEIARLLLKEGADPSKGSVTDRFRDEATVKMFGPDQ
mmetsp:Transcript_95070/g.174110  ORF Transcript_95070/g.174110 Transcript_95070/m.174110 type:complete len:298 (+) Transcript_95070:60-953(+)